VIEAKKHRRDVLTFVDGMIKRRRGGFLMFGIHEIKERERKELSRGQPEVIIVCTGTYGAAHIATEAQAWAKANKVSLLVQPFYDAIIKLNALVEQKKKVAALINITCRAQVYLSLIPL
jgi:hypothetical protein